MLATINKNQKTRNKNRKGELTKNRRKGTLARRLMLAAND
jgi:hypothetical protein